jgi:hypothetical protein
MTRLEQVTNVCMVVVSIAIVTDVATRRWSGTATATSVREAPPEYKAGDRLDGITGLRSTGDRSLLLVVRSGCTYCTQSLPFYERMARELKAAGGGVRLNAVCTEPADVCEKYLTTAGVTVDQVVGVPPGSLKIVGTPTLLLVGVDGRVSRVWRGLLDANGQNEVLSAILGKSVS